MARECRNRREIVIQWIGVFIALLGLAYNGVKDYQKGEIKFPKIQEKKVLTKVVYPVQYCLMAYDPNVDKVFYLHENGIWYDYAPQQRRYPSQAEPQQQNQTQGQEALGGSYRSSGTSGYSYGQSAQATSHATRY